MNNKMLFPNCSEEVFRLTGDLEDIKTEVLKMLDVVQKEYKEDGDSIDNIDKLRKKINSIKTLKDFEAVVFEFTCNYKTYFKKEGNDLLVATCNNHEWDEVDCIPESSDDYYKIVNENYYKLIFREGNYVIVEQKYAEKSKLVFLEVEGEINLEYDNTFNLIKKGRVFYISRDNELLKVKEIKDENLKNKLGILARL